MNIKSIVGLVAVVFIGLVGLISVFGTFEIIDQGERGVKLRNGEIVKIIDPGLAWKIPVLDTIKTISVQTLTLPLKDYKTYSSDQQPATLDVSVTFKVDETRVDEVYSEYGTINTLAKRALSPRLPTAIKNEFGKYSAENAIKNNDKLVIDITESLTYLTKNDPITIISVQIEKVEFSQSYETTIEDKQRADVMIATKTSNANALRAEAKGKKDAAILEAEGKAKAVILAGNAEADAIRVKAKALNENPGLVKLIIAERWNGVTPTSVTTLPGEVTPLLNVK